MTHRPFPGRRSVLRGSLAASAALTLPGALGAAPDESPGEALGGAASVVVPPAGASEATVGDCGDPLPHPVSAASPAATRTARPARRRRATGRPGGGDEVGVADEGTAEVAVDAMVELLDRMGGCV